MKIENLNLIPRAVPGNVVEEGQEGGEEDEPSQSIVVRPEWTADCKVSLYGDREGQIG